MIITNEELLKLANDSKSAAHLCRKLGYKSCSSYRKYLKPRLIKLGFKFTHWRKARTSDAELLEAAKNSTSVSQVMQKLGYNINGGRRHTDFKERLAKLGIKFKFNRIVPNKKANSIYDYLSNKVRINTARLRKLLIKEFLKEDKCEKCGLGPIWNGEPLSLQLDHIDGNSLNNELNNLRILCPNCHTQTPTHSKQKMHL